MFACTPHGMCVIGTEYQVNGVVGVFVCVCLYVCVCVCVCVSN
jgi:hypothetical protein